MFGALGILSWHISLRAFRPSMEKLLILVFGTIVDNVFSGQTAKTRRRLQRR